MIKKPDYTLVKPDPATDAELVALEEQRLQLSWFIQVEDIKIGVAWINLEGNEYIDSPYVYVSVDEQYRGQGIGSSVLKEMIKYAYCNLTSETLYSRQQVNDKATEKLNKKVGFETDDKPYVDSDGHEWQNVTLAL